MEGGWSPHYSLQSALIKIYRMSEIVEKVQRQVQKYMHQISFLIIVKQVQCGDKVLKWLQQMRKFSQISLKKYIV